MNASGTALQADRVALYSQNVLKLGFFGTNCSSGVAATKVPERWSGSWEDNLRLARMLDDAGIEFMLPVARWKGWGGETDFEGRTLETITWACGLLAATKQMTVFGTVHVPMVHPVFAAKQFVTVDHISRGRFGLNVVCGWNQGEFDMFGIEQQAHEGRYALGAEWLDVITKLWAESGSFDFKGTYFQLSEVAAEPKPYGDSRPVLMNAGLSPAGRAFALARADCLFTGMQTLEAGAASVASLKAEAQSLGRGVNVYTAVNMVCRPTDAEAAEYYNCFANEMADWGAVDRMVDTGLRHGGEALRQVMDSVGRIESMRIRRAAGYGGYPLVGNPDTVAAEIARISAAGFTGFAVGLVNYLDEFPYIQAELLPRLERLGLRFPKR